MCATAATGSPDPGANPAATEGLALWRKPDKSGAACASCHSPDGIEIAAYRFDDRTILRRASPHLGQAGAARILEYIHGLRSTAGIRAKFDPMSDRPMQPGGRVLPGATAADRDVAFGRTLVSLLPALMGKPIDTSEAASMAMAQIRSLDARKMRIGIPFNRLSEDFFHGPQHATIADWLPDTPIHIPLATLSRISDVYLKSPSDASFKAFLHEIEKTVPNSSADQLAMAKYRSMLIFQHELRTGRSIGTPTGANPMWEVAEVARMNAETTPASFGLPAEVIAKKSAGPSFAQQMKDMRLGWYWSGWLMDQGLRHSGPLKATQRGDYFSKLLLEEGPYPIHCAFMLTRKIAERGLDASSPIDVNYSFLVLRDGLDRFEPAAPEARSLFRTFVCNSFRMNLVLLADELERTRVFTEHKEPLQLQIRLMSDYLERAAPDRRSKDAALASRASNALAAAALVR